MAKVNVRFVQQIVSLYIHRVVIGIPTQSCVNYAVRLVFGYLAVGVGVGARAVLHAVAYICMQALPEVGLQLCHQFVSQILQRVLALYAVGLHLILVNVAVIYLQAFQYVLCRHHLL